MNITFKFLVVVIVKVNAFSSTQQTWFFWFLYAIRKYVIEDCF